ncbi:MULTISPECIES: DUF2164 domain-containing protein [Paenibacillus]|uniref:Uncharacterized protein (DUF2164 family) n=1 Tax=Paenibacillus lactis TaxID=228574 RepID=A0ABS4F4B3_9BACL|nr:DUF2164 domain-containing protein [Paenibacillus lactis]MBP1891094.1 uncharacterized protein (DUF2164 family) [Paenibacillus lactis]HAG00482.1 DUF2164 domain-containing protein [Paenibacillus lactis]
MRPIKLAKEQRDLLVEEVRHYFETERGEMIGHLAAEGILDYFAATLGPYIYNQALSDCRQVVNERMITLEEDIYALEKNTNTKRTR